jgi:hypothetical protein
MPPPIIITLKCFEWPFVAASAGNIVKVFGVGGKVWKK